jgi:hypothetical protein
MTPGTLLCYLLGSRRAIEAVAATPQAVWLGGLLVLSAAFAREYDGTDLLREPGHLAVPLGASLATSFVLFFLATAAFRPRRRERQHGPGFWRGYWSFLGLYWLTAPLAWLYAIPVERFLSPVGAVQANLWLLAIVSTWRVALMTRVVAVVFDARPAAAFFLVMFFADSVAVVALVWQAAHVLGVMSGARWTEAEGILRDWTQTTLFWSIMSWPVWLIGAIVVVFRRFYVPWQPRVLAVGGGSVGWSLWVLAAAALVVWAFILPFTQPPLRLAHKAEALVLSDRFVDGLREMSRHERSDYPPLWNPPPKPEHGDRQPGVVAIVQGLIEADAAPWVQEVYLDKIERVLRLHQSVFEVSEDVKRIGYDRFVKLLEQMPEGRRLMERNEFEMEFLRSQVASLEDQATRE